MIGPSALFALAAVAVALAQQISSGMYDGRAVALVSAGTAAAVVAAVWRKRAAGTESPIPSQALLGAGCAAGLACTLFGNPTFYGDPRAFRGGFQGVALTALVVLSAYLCLHLRASLIRTRFLLLLGCFAVMAMVVIRASPRPWVDVWEFQQAAADALLHGVNPYSISFRDIYGPRVAWSYPRQLMLAGRVNGFPYLPLTVLVDAPAFALLGDVRYALLGLLLGAAWLIARALPGSTGELAALLMLFQPRTCFILEQAWTEPLVIFCFALVVFCLSRSAHWALGGAALGLLAASKQYSPFMVVPLAVALPRRAVAIGAAVAVGVVAPFVLGDPAGFWRGVVQFIVLVPFRPDSLSLIAFAHRVLGPGVQASVILGPLIGLAVLGLCLRRRLGLPMAAAAAAASWAVVLLWSKQSFCNYWWLAAGLLAVAAASITPRTSAE